MPGTSRWRDTPPPGLDRAAACWLSRDGSLTRHLGAFGRVTVRPVREQVERGTAAGGPIWTREVLLAVDGLAVVTARSEVSLGASHGVWRAMRQLGKRPLADLLFADASVSRSGFSCGRLGRADRPYRIAMVCMPSSSRTSPLPPRLWARRSVFLRDDQPLALVECFLPAFWHLVDAHGRVAP